VVEEPQEISLCPTGNNFFFADFDDNTATFQWQESADNGATWTDMVEAYPFSGTTSEVLYLDSAIAAMDGMMYRCVATNGCGSTTSAEVHLYVTTSLGIYVTPDPVTIHLGETVELTAHGGSFYYWTDADDFIDSTGAVNVFTAHPVGNYTYTVYGALRGCQSPVPGVPVEDTCDWQPQDSCVITNRLDTLGMYQWYYDYSEDSIRICPCMYGEGYGGWGSYTGHINVAPNTVPNFPALPSICAGDPPPSLPTTSNNGITGSWSPSSVDNMSSAVYSFTPDPGQYADPTTLMMTVTQPTLPTFGQLGPYCELDPSTTFPTVSNEGITGIWSAPFPTTNFAGTTTYYFTPDPGQCAYPTQMNVTVNPMITSSVTPPGPFCVGQAASLPGTTDDGPGFNIVWTPSVINTSAPGIATYSFHRQFSMYCFYDGEVDIEVLPLIPSTFMPLASVCQYDTPPVLPGVSNEGISGTWSPAVLSTAGVGTVTAVFTPDPGQCGTTATLSLQVTAPTIVPDFTSIEGSTVCQYQGFPLPAVSDNGISGTWNPSGLDTYGVGLTFSTFYPNPGQCADQGGVNVFVIEAQTAHFNLPTTLCVGDAAPNLPTVSIEGVGGTWSPASISTATPGVKSATFTPFNTCDLGYHYNVTVKPHVIPTFTNPFPECYEGPTTIWALGSGNSSENGVLGTFSPPYFNITGPNTYYFLFIPNPGQCSENGGYQLVYTPPTATATFTLPLSVCQGSAAPVLPTTSNNGLTGTWMPSTISTASAGTVVATFYPTSGQCAGPFEHTFTISSTPIVPAFSFATTICQSGSAPALPTVSDNGVNGTWNPTSISTAATGVQTLVFTPDAGQCANPETITINIVSGTVITPQFNLPPSVCQFDSPPVLSSTSVNGITGTWNPPAFSSSSAGLQTAVFTPDGGQCATQLTQTLNVNSSPIPTFAALSAVCVGAVAPTLNTTSTNGVPGTWMPSSFSTGSAGTYMATFTPSAAVCAETTTISLTVNGGPIDIDMSGPLAFCDGSSVILTSSQPTGNVWSNGQTTQAITVTTNGSYYVSNNSSGCPSQSVPLTVVVNPLPLVVVGGDTPLCQGEVLQLTSNLLVDGVYAWTGPNGFTSSVQNPLLGPSNPSQSGIYVLTITSPDGCVGTNSYAIQVNTIPAVSIGSLPVLCENHDPVMLTSGSPAGGIYSGTGVVGGQQFDPGVSGDGNFTVTYSWSDGNCTGVATGIQLVDDCAGLVDLEKGMIEIYPNPATNVLHVSATDSTIDQLLVYDQAGRLVLARQLNGIVVADLDVSHLERGSYLLVIQSNGGEVVKRFVKQ